jgi:hypothetical protein
MVTREKKRNFFGTQILFLLPSLLFHKVSSGLPISATHGRLYLSIEPFYEVLLLELAEIFQILVRLCITLPEPTMLKSLHPLVCVYK